MSWPIPDIPDKEVLSRPRLRRWILFLIFIVLSAAALAIFIFNMSSYRQIIVLVILPACLFWLLLYGLVLFHYEQSLHAARLWNREREKVRTQWRVWSQQQRAILANVILSPEASGAAALTGDYAAIPAWPAKCRPLLVNLAGIEQRLQHIDRDIEEQFAGYRHHLSRIVVLHGQTHNRQNLTRAIYSQWDLPPEYLMQEQALYSVNQEDTEETLSLLLCIQDWSVRDSVNHSELIGAQLFSSTDWAKSRAMVIQAGCGRLLNSDSVTDALDMLIEYNQLDLNRMNNVWLTGVDSDTQATIALYAAARNWPLPLRRPFLLLDHTFGPPGPIMSAVSVGLLTEEAIRCGDAQLLISRYPHGSFELCLITKELLL